MYASIYYTGKPQSKELLELPSSTLDKFTRRTDKHFLFFLDAPPTWTS